MGRSARKPAGFRNVDGILLLDKPLGISSNTALQRVRHLFKANKAGHTGSLDPLATGMLPICFGEAAKFSSYLLDAGKSYRATCCLGKTTATGDAEGEVLLEREPRASLEQVKQTLNLFRGKISQIPPMYSAVKHKGQRLYQLARQGQEVERKSREVEIRRLDLIAFSDHELKIEVECSKGTYIRTLAEDIGEALGCGAHLTQLHRVSVHPFWGINCTTFDDIDAFDPGNHPNPGEFLLPVNAALTDYPEVVINEIELSDIRKGRKLDNRFELDLGIYNLIGSNREFIGLAEVTGDGQIRAKRLMNTGT